MTIVTIDAVLAAQAQLNDMIATLQAASTPKLLLIRESQIEIKPGEAYAGLVLDADGLASHHLVLLPGEAEDVSWRAAVDWATSIGGELPSRQEQSLLYANRKGDFKAAWYWSAEAHKDDGSYAWGQDFGNGDQNLNHKSYEGRARAVRRVTA